MMIQGEHVSVASSARSGPAVHTKALFGQSLRCNGDSTGLASGCSQQPQVTGMGVGGGANKDVECVPVASSVGSGPQCMM
jgi:hypothetical protein